MDHNVGADAWRRTGVLTFNGNAKLKKSLNTYRISLVSKYHMVQHATTGDYPLPRSQLDGHEKGFVLSIIQTLIGQLHYIQLKDD